MIVRPVTNIPDNPPEEIILNQDKFDRGVIDLIDQTKLPRNALKTADNIRLAEDGAPMVTEGVDWYGAELPASIDGGSIFYDGGNVHLVVAAGGKIYRSTDHAETWTECTGATLEVGESVEFKQAREFLYIYNGEDHIIRYNGTTTLQVFSGISKPTGTNASRTGLSGSTFRYYYRVSAVNEVGYTEGSVADDVQVSRQRANFDDSNFVTLTWNSVSGASRYDIYVGLTPGEEKYIDSIENGTTYIDQGQALALITGEVPEDNTTQAPRVGDMELIGDRLIATRDKDHPYRIWISGAGSNIAKFSLAYDATWVELQRGSQFTPQRVVDYRDGRGEPLITAWYDSADSLGCVWQGKIETFTVGDSTFPVPAFYKLPGSRGTNAPMSVVNVLNDYVYYNQQAFYNLGSRAQFLNLLSTDEISTNVRNFMRKINRHAAHKIAAHFQDNRLYVSVPFNSNENSVTMVHDTSINGKPWLPKSFTMGFARFFRYVDTNGVQLLAWKQGDNRLSVINEDINGFYGEPIDSVLETGLRQINEKDRFAFMMCEEAEFEFARPRGKIQIELSGLTRETGFTQLLPPKTITPVSTRFSWTMKRWTTSTWTDTDTEAEVLSEPTIKRYFLVGREINAYQYRVVCQNDLTAQYILRTLQVRGRTVSSGKPPDWELLE